MKTVLSRSVLTALLVIIPAFGLDKEPFKAGRAETYAAKSDQGKVTVAVAPFGHPDQIRQAFGKADLDKYGVLPVLIVIDNNGSTTLKLDMVAEYVTADGKHVEAIPADEVMYLNTPKRPKMVDTPRFPIPTKKPKNKLEAWEVTGRAFTAKMVPAGESVSGFVYFQVRQESGARIYINRLSDANTRKDLFYFEIPLPND